MEFFNIPYGKPFLFLFEMIAVKSVSFYHKMTSRLNIPYDTF